MIQIVPVAVGAFVATNLDNFALLVTFGALFADSDPASDALILLTAVAMAIAFFFSAQYAVRHPLLKKWIESHAHQITPFMLIGVGIYIISGTTTDAVPD